jgi:hypothetical protein
MVACVKTMLLSRSGRFKKNFFHKCYDIIYDLRYNLVSGFLAATASSIGKIGMEYESIFVIKILIIIASIICNSFMHIFFFKSMQSLGPAKATVLNFCVNFLLTVIYICNV